MGTLVNEISEVDLMGITNIEELYVLTNPGDPELKDYSGISWKFRTRDIPNGFDYRLFPLRENSGDFGSVLISSPCSVHDEKGNEIRVVLTRELVVEKILESEFQRQIVQSGKRRQPRNGVSQKILNEETESGNIY